MSKDPLFISRDGSGHAAAVVASGAEPATAAILRHEERQKLLAERRLAAVREAYWANLDQDSLDFAHLGAVLAELELIEQPSAAQVRALFMLLPADIIGRGIAWGFSDSEVHASVAGFVTGHPEAIRAAGLERSVR